MSRYICIDSSVLIKIFIKEEDSCRAKVLLKKVVEDNQIILLPAFAWAEVGTIIRKKARAGIITTREADEMWFGFRQLPGIKYLEDELVAHQAWKISRSFDLPTLYDAAFLAVAETITLKTGDVCEFWTADEKLINSLNGKKGYVNFLNDI